MTEMWTPEFKAQTTHHAQCAAALYRDKQNTEDVWSGLEQRGH